MTTTVTRQDIEHISNTNMIRPIPSKSADTKQHSCLYDISPEKSTSLTLAERRRNHHIPASLKLCTSDAASVVVKEEQVS